MTTTRRKIKAKIYEQCADFVFSDVEAARADGREEDAQHLYHIGNAFFGKADELGQAPDRTNWLAKVLWFDGTMSEPDEEVPSDDRGPDPDKAVTEAAVYNDCVGLLTREADTARANGEEEFAAHLDHFVSHFKEKRDQRAALGANLAAERPDHKQKKLPL